MRKSKNGEIANKIKLVKCPMVDKYDQSGFVKIEPGLQFLFDNSSK